MNIIKWNDIRFDITYQGRQGLLSYQLDVLRTVKKVVCKS